MSAPADVLWLRAVRAADARGLLPANRSPLTPGELAAEVARRGEDRLTRLVDGWYYPASYGRIRGTLSDDEAVRIVAALEADIAPVALVQPQIVPPVSAPPRVQRIPTCELCGRPLNLSS